MRILVIVTLVGLLAGCGSDKASQYVKKSKATEAKVNLQALARGAEAYFAEEHMGGLTVVSSMLPDGQVGPTPVKGACCPDKCAPKAEHWDHPIWRALNFEISMPHYFSYEYKQVGTRGEKGYGIELSAYGDLDCDGTYSTYVWSGTVDEDMGPGIVSPGTLMETNPLE